MPDPLESAEEYDAPMIEFALAVEFAMAVKFAISSPRVFELTGPYSNVSLL